MITIHFKKKRIFVPLLLILPLFVIIEVIAFIPLTILAVFKRKFVFFRIASGFYFSRLILAIILYGRKLKIITGEVTITGEHIPKLSYSRSKRRKTSYLTSQP